MANEMYFQAFRYECRQVVEVLFVLLRQDNAFDSRSFSLQSDPFYTP